LAKQITQRRNLSPSAWILRKKVVAAIENVQRDALGGCRIILGDVRAQGEKIVNGFGGTMGASYPFGDGRSLRPSHEATRALTRSCRTPLPRSSDTMAPLMLATCHSFTSKYA
jgi:hypothetical protein